MLTLGSLFDGIGGWQLAAIRAGVTPVWSSEIEKLPLAVTKFHFPNTLQLGAICTNNLVRRLTPLECERLMGLPDNWTLINDKSCSDSARYKAIGNGMAQPVADWIINNIREVTT